MINVKPIIYKELKNIAGNVSDTFPQEEANFPAIMYLEERNEPYEIVDDGESKSSIAYKVDIWDTKSTSNTAVEVDRVFSKLGLFRKSSIDIPEPGGLRHKQMRFEGIVDLDNMLVYQNRYE